MNDLSYDSATKRWFYNGFVIKQMEPSSYVAWSHDWDPKVDRGKELSGPTLQELMTAIDTYEAKYPAG